MLSGISVNQELSVESVGGKGQSLNRLSRADYTVPDGIILESDAFFETLKANDVYDKTSELVEELNMATFDDVGTKLRELIESLEISDQLQEGLDQAVTQITTEAVAVRSSAVSEDSKQASFAGLHDTYLNVPNETEKLFEKVRSCWESLFTDRAIVYREQKGISHWEGMAVIIQELVDPDVSGITFTSHPQEKTDILIEAAQGFGDIIVGGEINPDEYRISSESWEFKERHIGSKKRVSQPDQEGVVISTQDQGNTPALSDSEIIDIARQCKDIEQLFEYPQDVEWCYQDGTLHIVQSRPITGDAK